jgi:hypothetical protein
MQSDNDQDLPTLIGNLRAVAEPLVRQIHASGKTNDLAGTDAWYQGSYSVFTASPPTEPASAEEFLRIVACAYSWVATIPDADPRPHFDSVRAAIEHVTEVEANSSNDIQKVRNARASAIQKVKDALGIASVEGSVVITSKVLHFWRPSLAPMIDVNVATAWKELADIDERWTAALQGSGNDRISTLSKLPRTEQYLSYWQLAYRLRGIAGGPSYRDLDELMFYYRR